MRTLLLASFALLLSACHVDIDPWEHDDRGPPPSGRHSLGGWGASCRSDLQCKADLACIDAVCEPARIGIRAVGALVAPGKADGREWDDDRYLPSWVWDELDRASRRGVPALFDFMDEQRRLGWSRPDPYGYGFLSTDGRFFDDRNTIALVERGSNALDVFDVTWPGPVGWSDVPFTERLLVGFDLYDEDRRDDDEIGYVELDFAALRTALYMGGTVWFDTWDATEGQLLLFGVEVYPER